MTFPDRGKVHLEDAGMGLLDEAIHSLSEYFESIALRVMKRIKFRVPIPIVFGESAAERNSIEKLCQDHANRSGLGNTLARDGHVESPRAKVLWGKRTSLASLLQVLVRSSLPAVVGVCLVACIIGRADH